MRPGRKSRSAVIASAVAVLRESTRGRYAASAFAGQTLFAIVSFSGSIMTARLFGPIGRGELTAWFLAANIGSLVLAGPLPVGMGRGLLGGTTTRIVFTTWVHAAAGAAAASIAALLAIAAGVDPLTAFVFLVVVVPTGTVVNDLIVVFQAAKQPWAYHASRLPLPGVLAAGLAVLWIARPTVSLTEAYVLLGIGSVCSAVVASVLARLRLPQSSPGRASVGIADQLSSFARLGRGSYSAVLLDTLLLRADQFVILIAGPAELGLYVVAVNCAEISLYAGHAIGQAAFEDEATLGRSQGRRLMFRAAATVAAIGAMVAVAGFFLITPVFGDSFETSRYALLLLTPGVVARTAAYTGGQILLAQGLGASVSRVLAVTMGAALPMSALGARQFGVYGVAMASTLAYSLQMLLIVRQFHEPRLE